MNKVIPMGAPGRQRGPQGLRKANGTLKPGSVVFFNGCKKSTKQNSEPFIFKGHGFGVFLGVVPTNVKEPAREQMDGLLAGIGWVSFENVAELLGEEQFDLLAKKFQEKYGLEPLPEDEKMPENPPAPIAEPELTLPPEKQLLGADGRPMFKADEEPPDAIQ